MTQDQEIKRNNNKLIPKKLVGQKAWGVELGVGSFITMEFGDPKLPDKGGKIHGEWHLWIYSCAWRIEKNGEFLVGCEEDRNRIKEVLKQFEGATIQTFDMDNNWDAIIQFDNLITLRLFSIFSEEQEHWMLFTPSNTVFVAGPGSIYTLESA